MKICFTSDLHGSDSLYAQLDGLLLEEKPDLVILGGDLFSDGEQPEEPGGQLAEVRDRILPQIRRWSERSSELQVLILSGNHDWQPTVDFLAQNVSPPLFQLDEQPLAINGVQLQGFGYTPWTPHGLKDFERLDVSGDPLPSAGGYAFDVDAGEVKQVSADDHYNAHPAMSEMLNAVPNCDGPLIFVAHAPPINSRLDELPEIDGAIGSRAVRAFIEQRQPLVTLHGHVHESYLKTGQWHAMLGKTLCINPGQQSDQLHAVLFESEDPQTSLRHTVLP